MAGFGAVHRQSADLSLAKISGNLVCGEWEQCRSGHIQRTQPSVSAALRLSAPQQLLGLQRSAAKVKAQLVQSWPMPAYAMSYSFGNSQN